MGRGLVALAVLLALTGCSAVAMPEPGLSEAEREIVQQQTRDNYWAVTGLPDEQRPAATPMTVVPSEEWPTRFVECMNAQGFANYAVAGDGYSTYTIESEDPTVEALASYVCSTSFWTDYGWFNTAQLDYLYDYYEQTLVPCLAVHNAQIWGAPSREKFYAQGGGWHPYFNFPKKDQERIFADEALPDECPPVPPGMDDPGFSWLWR